MGLNETFFFPTKLDSDATSLESVANWRELAGMDSWTNLGAKIIQICRGDGVVAKKKHPFR